MLDFGLQRILFVDEACAVTCLGDTFEFAQKLLIYTIDLYGPLDEIVLVEGKIDGFVSLTRGCSPGRFDGLT